MPGENTVVGIAKLIPEVYFDLISRIPVGAVILILMIWAYDNPTGEIEALLERVNSLEGLPSLGALVIFLIIAYLIAILLTPFGRGIYHVEAIWIKARIKKHYSKVVDQFCKDNKDIKDPFSIPSGFENLRRRLDDHVKSGDPQAKELVPKMTAEASLCNNLAGGLLILSAVAIILHFLHSLTWNEGHTLLLLVPLTLSLIAGTFRSYQYWRRLLSYLAQQYES